MSPLQPGEQPAENRRLANQHEDESQMPGGKRPRDDEDPFFSFAQLAGMMAWVILVSIFYGFLLPTKTTEPASNVLISLVNGAQLTMTYVYCTKHSFPELFTQDRTNVNMAYWTLTHLVPICAGYILNGEWSFARFCKGVITKVITTLC